jgi:hypothetical protein
MKSNTPRTDAICRLPYTGDDVSAEHANLLLDHARQLECELAEAKTEITRLVRALEDERGCRVPAKEEAKTSYVKDNRKGKWKAAPGGEPQGGEGER